MAFFEQNDNTQILVQHCEDLKDGRAFAEVARRVSKCHPTAESGADFGARRPDGKAATSEHMREEQRSQRGCPTR
jgi:putative component of membrane protein insertase Oxa1/YidC/SpoIIIJ protein YidD